MTEPYQGGAGFINPPEGWLKELESWARSRGLLFIVDEVQSSFGRTGRMFAIEHEGVKPNMLCIGKGIGSGMPTSALAGETEIFRCMKPGEMSSTTGGNPLASAAALVRHRHHGEREASGERTTDGCIPSRETQRTEEQV